METAPVTSTGWPQPTTSQALCKWWCESGFVSATRTTKYTSPAECTCTCTLKKTTSYAMVYRSGQPWILLCDALSYLVYIYICIYRCLLFVLVCLYYVKRSMFTTHLLMS